MSRGCVVLDEEKGDGCVGDMVSLRSWSIACIGSLALWSSIACGQKYIHTVPVTFGAILGVASARIGNVADVAAVADASAIADKILTHAENMVTCMFFVLSKDSSSWTMDYVARGGRMTFICRHTCQTMLLRHHSYWTVSYRSTVPLDAMCDAGVFRNFGCGRERHFALQRRRHVKPRLRLSKHSQLGTSSSG